MVLINDEIWRLMKTEMLLDDEEKVGNDNVSNITYYSYSIIYVMDGANEIIRFNTHSTGSYCCCPFHS